MSRARDTLALVGDGDEQDLRDEVEQIFGVTFTDDELSKIYNAGDLHMLIMAKLGAGSGRPCLSARAFRRLRAALDEGRWVRPGTSLIAVAPERGYRAWLERIEGDTGLELTRAGCHWTALTLGWAAFFGVLGAFVWSDLRVELGVLAALSTLGLWLLSFPKARFPLVGHSKTLGDLIRASSPSNFQRLRRAGEAPHQVEVWRILADVCRDISGRRGPITRETEFY